MTNIEYTNWLKRMIEGCDDIKGLEREKAIYQQCLKKARNLGQELPIHNVSNSLVADIRNKLNPINNLCAMLRNAPRNLTDDEDINNIIFSEIKQCKKSIEYLSNL